MAALPQTMDVVMKSDWSKLEEIASRNMAALLSNPRSVGENGDVNAAALAGGAITAAKELLKQLDQCKTE